MNKNVKRIFFVLTLLTLLCTISAVNAVDDNSTDNIISETSTTTNNEVVTTDTPQVSANKDKVNTNNEKQIEKKDKNIKTETDKIKTSNLSSITLIENELNSLMQEDTYNHYIINITGDSYLNDKITIPELGDKKLTINGNNYKIEGRKTINTKNGTILFNNFTIQVSINSYANTTITNSLLTGTLSTNNMNSLTIVNSSIYKRVYQYKKVANGIISLNNCYINASLEQFDNDFIIDDYCTFGPQTTMTGIFICNDFSKIEPYIIGYKGNNTLNNQNINTNLVNYGEIYINSTNATNRTYNYGNMTIENSDISYSNAASTLSSLENYGNINITNTTIKNTFINNANATLNQHFLDYNQYLTNNGYMIIEKSLLNSTINNSGILIITDDSQIGENFNITGSGEIITNNTKIKEILNNNGIYYGNKTIQDNIDKNIVNFGNLTLINSNITAQITNNGDLTLVNCSLVGGSVDLVVNNGVLTVVNCTFKDNLANVINSTGDLIIDNCVFDNNVGNVYVDCSKQDIVVNISNSNFTGKKDNYEAVYLNNTDCTLNSTAFLVGNNFYNNIYSKFNKLVVENNTFYNVQLTGYNYNTYSVTASNIVKSNVFNNSNASLSYLEAYNNTFYGGRLGGNTVAIQQWGTDYCNIYSNTFNNASINLHCAQRRGSDFSNSAEPSSIVNNSVHDNVFNGKSSQSDAIRIGFIEYNNYTEIYNNTFNKASLNDTLTYDLLPKIYCNDTIGFTYTLNNPLFYDNDILDDVTFDVYVEGQLYQENITDSQIKINTTGELLVVIEPSISSSRFSKIIEVLPIKDIIITPDNYDNYIIDGTLMRAKADNRIVFNGNFTDKGEILIETSDIVIDGKDATFTNTAFIIDANNILIENMNITNTQTEYAIINNGNNNYIRQNTINVTRKDGLTAAIKNTGSNTNITKNNLYIDGPAKTIDFTSGGIANTQAILLIGGDKNTINENNITATTTQESETYGTIEAITNTNGATNTLITKNNINVNNAKFTYAINSLVDVSNINITENNITATSYRYADGIQVGNNAQNININQNTININCHNTTPVDEEAIGYGIITTNMGSNTKSTQINITQNNITVQATVGYGIEIYQTTQTRITYNNILVNGTYSMGIGYAHSPSSRLIGNNITIKADSTKPIGQVTEEIQPENVGIKIQQNSTNIVINSDYRYGYDNGVGNIIRTNDRGKQDWAINIESADCSIYENTLRSTNGAGNDAIKNTTPYNKNTGNSEGLIFTDLQANIPSQAIVNHKVPINITIKDEYNNPLYIPIYTSYYNETTQHTIYDEIKGNITLSLTINNQTENITIENESTTYYYTPTQTGTDNITVTFKRAHTYESSTTTKTLQVSTIQLNIDPLNIQTGQKTNITAKIQLDNQTYTDINKGKITFKANGKTLKDENGKVIYAKVINGTATIENYQVPDTWNENTTIEATYSGSTQLEKLTSEKTSITITPKEVTLTTEPITATAGTSTTLTATLSDNTINTGKIVFKINGKTVKDANGKVIYAKVVNGTVSVDYTLPESYKAGNYTVTATFVASGYDRLVANTTMTVEN